MVNVKFNKQILDTEMTVVRNEFERGENSPRVDSAASAWPPPRTCGTTTASRTIGSKDDIEKRADRPPGGVLPQVSISPITRCW